MDFGAYSENAYINILLFIIIIISLAIFLSFLAKLFIIIFENFIAVAIKLFEWAMEWGWVGFISYVAAWVFMFPFMVIICVIGALLNIGAKKDEERHFRRSIEPNMPKSEAEALKWQEEDRNHREAVRRKLDSQSHLD